MWKRGGRSSALDRATALLQSAKRDSRAGSPSAKTQASAGGSRPAHVVFSDVSDLSSDPEHGADTVGASKTLDREGGSTKDLRPPSSLGGGGGQRFLKKAPPPVTNSSQLPARRNQMLQSESRNVSSSQQGSQTAALSRLAVIENRVRSNTRVSKPPADQSLDAPLQHSAQSSSEQSLQGKRFLKSNTTVAINKGNSAAAGSQKAQDDGCGSRSKAADALIPSEKTFTAVQGVSLDSDEEDMKKLLGNPLDSVETSFIKPGRPASITSTDFKIQDQRSQKVHFTWPPAAFSHSSTPMTASPHPPVSPPRQSSPFRFTGQAQAHFSPLVLSLSPSPPPGRLNFPHRAESPQRSLSTMSGHSELVSLDELFPVEDAHSQMSEVSSEDFKIDMMTLDDLVPADLGLTKKAAGDEREYKLSASTGSPNSPQRQRRLKEKVNTEEQKQLEEEDVLDYQSDFESESRTCAEQSASQVSEHLQGQEDEAEGLWDSDVSLRRSEDDSRRDSSTFSDTSHSINSQISGHCITTSRSRSPRLSVSYSNQELSRQSRRRASARKDLKEAAVQTLPDPQAYTWPTAVATPGPEVDMAFMYPTPAVTHALSAEMVEALSKFNPGMIMLYEMVKQQLAMTKRFMERSRQLHDNLLQSLEPPNYRYTTLEDTKEYISKHIPPKLTMDKALQEVQKKK